MQCSAPACPPLPTPGAVEHALLSHYPINSALQLGYGNPHQLLQLLASTSGPPPPVAGAEGAEPRSPAQQLLDQLQQVARSQEQQQVLHIWAAQGMNSAGGVQGLLFLK